MSGGLRWPASARRPSSAGSRSPSSRRCWYLSTCTTAIKWKRQAKWSADSKAVGGQYSACTGGGDGQAAVRPVPPAEQRRALAAVLATVSPRELALPRALLGKIPPRPSGFPEHRELFDKVTDPVFDVISPAAAAADMVLQLVLNPERAARLVQQHALDPAQPGLAEVLDSVL